jgi:predicted nucleotidyltransferase component of viral defense system
LLKESSLADIRDIEGLMVFIINLLGDRFGSNAILKGGMQLRLVDSPRFTNDLDYVFIPFSSKKEIKNRILKTLNEIPELTISYTINSKCIRYLVAYEDIKVQV